MADQIQIVRRGIELWELTRVRHTRAGEHEYELIGRVIRDADLYYVEFPEWKESSFEWARQPRGYLIPRAAFKVITDRKTVLQ
jgi:hypothetical protein